MNNDIKQNKHVVDMLSKGEDMEGFQVKFINSEIGSGVFTTKAFKKGDFLLEYDGEVISKNEGMRRLDTYPPGTGSFIFFVKSKNGHFCIDGTFSKRIAKFINDGINEEQNAKMRTLDVGGQVHLALFAIKDILPGEEVRYDYGVKNLPWRIKRRPKNIPQINSSDTFFRKSTVIKSEKFEENLQRLTAQMKDSRPLPADQRLKMTKPCSVKLKRFCMKQLKGIGTFKVLDSGTSATPSTEIVPCSHVVSSQEASHQSSTDQPPHTEPLHQSCMNQPPHTDAFHQSCTDQPPHKEPLHQSCLDQPPHTEAFYQSCSDQPQHTEASHQSCTDQPPHTEPLHQSCIDQPKHIETSHQSCTDQPPCTEAFLQSCSDQPPHTEPLHQSCIDQPPCTEAFLKSCSDQLPHTEALHQSCTDQPPCTEAAYMLSSVLHDRTEFCKDAVVSSQETQEALHQSCTGQPPQPHIETASMSQDKTEFCQYKKVISEIWESKKYQTNQTLGRVGPFTITTQSICNLRTLLSDEIIDAYLHLLTSKLRRSFHVNSVYMTGIFNNTPVVHGHLQQINLCDYDHLVGAINEGGIHWTLMVIKPMQRQILYYDPLGETVDSVEQLLKNWYLFLNERSTFGLDGSDDLWEIIPAFSSRQIDGTSCGVYILKMAEDILCGNTPSSYLTPQDVLDYRKHIGACILEEMGSSRMGFIHLEAALMCSFDCMTESNDYVDEILDDDFSFLDLINSQMVNKADTIEANITIGKDTGAHKELTEGTNSKEQTEAAFELVDIVFEEQADEELERQINTAIEEQVNEAIEGQVDEVNAEDADDEQPNKAGPEITVKKTKPKRPCPFCGQFKLRLTKHLQTVHKTEEEVKAAMRLPKQDRDDVFCLLKRKGYSLYNFQKLKENNLDDKELIKERKSRTNKPEERLMCSMCSGFFVKDHIRQHKSKCKRAEHTTNIPAGIQLAVMKDTKKYSDAFINTVLTKFLDDDVGKFIRSDSFIKDYGSHYFKRVIYRVDKSQEIRVSIMGQMRRLGNLFFYFKAEVEKTFNIVVSKGSDMFNSDLFHCLRDAIIEMSIKEDGGQKYGLKKSIASLLKKSLIVLNGQCLESTKINERENLVNFETKLKFFWIDIFDDADYNCLKARQLELRKPKRLPDEDNIIKLRDFILAGIKELECEFQYFSGSQYTQLRDLVVSRLTLHNARRGGEPSRLTIQEWKDAEESAWVDKNSINKTTDPLERKLLSKYKLAYQSGKCITQMVPSLIPDDCIKAIKKLVDPQVREAAGVHKNNAYTFPHVKKSLNHVSGWHCVSNICKQAGLDKRINATDMRHRASTIYASLDVPDIDRDAFYRHMGHSEEINKHVYQCPLGRKEITSVGKFFDMLDNLPCSSSLSTMYQSGKDSQVTEGLNLQSDLEQNNSNLSQVQEFIGYLVEQHIFTKVMEEEHLIEEDEVETIPEKLIFYKDFLMNKDLQKDAKKYFTEDGWLTAMNTINSITSTRIPTRKQNRGLKELKRKRTVIRDSSDSEYEQDEDEATSDSFEPVESDASMKALPTRKHNRGFKELKRKRTVIRDSSDSEYEQDEGEATSDSFEPVESDASMKDAAKVSKGHFKKARAYVQWNEKDQRIVKEFFYEYIMDTSSLDSKGSLPGKKKIIAFVNRHPEVLADISDINKKLQTIKNKIMNERNKTRRLYQNRMNKYCN